MIELIKFKGIVWQLAFFFFPQQKIVLGQREGKQQF